jgi:gentisate 1,2-dioxygenase
MEMGLTSKAVSLRLGGSAERLDAGRRSPRARETASSVYHVIEGSGYTEIDGKRLEWKQNDTFCIPAWHPYQHFADSGNTVYLYRFDDKPMLKALGFYRVEGEDTEKYVEEQ